MDAISGAGSAIAIVSLAIQLADSIAKLSDFLESIQEAPDKIKSILTDLHVLSLILHDIRDHQNKYGSNASVVTALGSLELRVTAFMALIRQYEPSFESSRRRIRKWTAVKAAFKEKKLKDFQLSLNNTKITLSLSMNQLQLSNQQENVMMIIDSVKNLDMNQSSRTIITSSKETAIAHDDHLTDIQTELRRMASTMNPAQQSIFVKGMEKILQELLPTSDTQQDDLTLGKVADSEPDPGNKFVSCSSQQSPQDNETDPAVSIHKRPSQRRSHNSCRTFKFSTTRTGLGTVYLKSIIHNNREACSRNNCSLSHSAESRYETSFILHPAEWLVWLGMKTGLDGTFSRSIQGWKGPLRPFCTLRPFCAVPDDALIFDFCLSGNIDGVRTLLVRGDASVWDRNSTGETPLHKAVLGGQTQMCKFLIDEGAERTATEYSQNRPVYRNFYWRDLIPIDILRYFIDFPDFSDSCERLDDGNCHRSWNLLLIMSITERDDGYTSISSDEGRRVYPKTDSAGVWLTKLFLSDISENLIEFWVVKVWIYAGSVLFLEWLVDITRSTDLTICKETGWSPINVMLNFTLGYGNPDYWVVFEFMMPKIKLLIEMGAPPHYKSCMPEDGPYGVTPTAILILDPFLLVEWRKILQERDTDIEHFVEQELKEGPLKQDGWSQKTLVRLFVMHIDYKVIRWHIWHECSFCDSQVARFRKPWMLYLDALKNGQDFDELGEYHVEFGRGDQEFDDDDQEPDVDDQEPDVDDQEPDVDDQGPDGYNRVSETWYCFKCAIEKVWLFKKEPLEEPLTLAMPGSFEPTTI